MIQEFLLTFRASDRPDDADKKGSEQRSMFTQFIFNACMAYCD